MICGYFREKAFARPAPITPRQFTVLTRASQPESKMLPDRVTIGIEGLPYKAERGVSPSGTLDRALSRKDPCRPHRGAGLRTDPDSVDLGATREGTESGTPAPAFDDLDVVPVERPPDRALETLLDRDLR